MKGMLSVCSVGCIDVGRVCSDKEEFEKCENERLGLLDK